MKKSVELAQKITALKNGIQGLIDNGQALEAEKQGQKLTALVAEYNKVVADEKSDENNFINNEIYGGKKTMDFKAKNRVFNKVLLGKQLTAEEAEYAKTLKNTLGTGQNETNDADGAVLVPVEHYNRVVELKKQYTPLKNYCWVYPAKSKTGTIPTLAGTSDKLTNFDELDEITKHKAAFGKVAYSLKLMGDLIPVSNALAADTDVNLIDVIGSVFAKKAVNSENADILAILETKATGTEATGHFAGTDYKVINKILNKYLDPAVSKNAVIITNQSGFDYLDGLVDENLRPLLTTSLADETVKKFKGREIVVLSDADLENPATGSYPFIVGDLKEAVVFADRAGLEVAVSTEAGFTSYSTMLRAVERYDVKALNSAAFGYGVVTPA